MRYMSQVELTEKISQNLEDAENELTKLQKLEITYKKTIEELTNKILMIYKMKSKKSLD